jgi:hemoglobin
MEAPPDFRVLPAPPGAAERAHENPHFRDIGGSAAIAQLVERFYGYMETLPEAAGIRALHAPELTQVKEVLIRYLTEWMGGPPVYSSERGHPRLRRRHHGFSIGTAERDAWMMCMHLALRDVVPDEGLRVALESAFLKIADFLRNRAE